MIELPDDLAPEEFPEPLDHVAEALGAGVAGELIRSFGGRSVYFPAGPLGSDHPLVRALGEDHALAVCELLSMEQVPIPTGAGIVRRRDRRRILQLAGRGLGVSEIAERVGYSARQVSRILRGGRGSRAA
ncbi:MAG: hypothetical protein KC466_08560 [Myxococcales bacterium]|nr:hypothetical protein [Myxococcales bacterium]